MVIEVNTRFHRLLHRQPVGLFKALLRPGGNLKKATILRVKSLQDGAGNQGFECGHGVPPALDSGRDGHARPC